MTKHNEKRKIAVLLFLYSLFHASAVAFSSYRSVYLQSIGYGSAKLGVVNAFVYVGIFTFIFLSGMLCDKLGSLKKVLAPAVVVTAVLFALIPTVGDMGVPFILLALYFAVSYGFNDTTYSLTDNLYVRTCAERGLNFGAVRSVESVAYAVFSIACIYLVPKLGVKSTYYFFAAAFIPTFIMLLILPDVEYTARNRKKLNVKPLFKIREYWVFLLFMFVCYLAQKPYNDLMTVYMKELNINTDMYGLIVAMRAIFEVPSLLLLAPLRRRAPLPLLIAGSLTITALSAVFMGLVRNSLTSMVILFAIAGIGNGFQIGTASNYIYQLAPRELKATAASGLMIISSLAGLFGNLFGGVIMEKTGAMPFYLAVGVVMLAAVAVFTAANLSRSKEKSAAK